MLSGHLVNGVIIDSNGYFNSDGNGPLYQFFGNIDATWTGVEYDACSAWDLEGGEEYEGMATELPRNDSYEGLCNLK